MQGFLLFFRLKYLGVVDVEPHTAHWWTANIPTVTTTRTMQHRRRTANRWKAKAPRSYRHRCPLFGGELQNAEDDGHAVLNGFVDEGASANLRGCVAR